MQTDKKQSTHTPGPWSTNGNGNVVGADGTLVTSVPRPKGTGASVKRDANAQLIAAAPELLEALKACVADADKAVNPSNRMFGYSEAKSAIAKATGGAR